MAPPVREQFAGNDFGGGLGYEVWMFGGSLNSEQIRRARRWLIVSGILALITGVVAIAVPAIASVTTTIFVGWILIAAAISIGIQAISHRAPVRGLEALLAFVAGCYVLVFPLSGTVTLTFVLAVWFFASGVLSLSLAFQWGGGAASWMNAISGGPVRDHGVPYLGKSPQLSRMGDRPTDRHQPRLLGSARACRRAPSEAADPNKLIDSATGPIIYVGSVERWPADLRPRTRHAPRTSRVRHQLPGVAVFACERHTTT